MVLTNTNGQLLTKAVEHYGQYGAGGPKVALSAGIPREEGIALVEAYWKKNWAIRQVADNCTVKDCEGSRWLFNPVSRFWYSLRHDKDRFSTLCQGTGVYCFDTWIKNILLRRNQITATFHDEGVWEIVKGYREQCSQLLTEAIEATNTELKLNVPLAIDIQFGDNYAEIH